MEEPTVPQTATPPAGVTWHVGVTENVSLASLQALFASFLAANNSIWNLSEGQVRIHRLRFWDNVAPGLWASQFFFGAGNVDTSNLDVLVFPQNRWDVPVSGAVGAFPGIGRTGRIMVVPMNASTFVLTHEGSHFLFNLSWAPAPMLFDEYVDGVQDPACVMESPNTPARWCSASNHVNQGSQPRACWAQILMDYPNFAHSGADSAAGLPETPLVEYTNAP